jgi:hypothetical protein
VRRLETYPVEAGISLAVSMRYPTEEGKHVKLCSLIREGAATGHCGPEMSDVECSLVTELRNLLLRLED